MPFYVLLVFALLIGNVTLRTFTNGFAVLPKVLNVIDIPIVGLLFLIFLAQRGSVSPPLWTRTIGRRLLAFCAVLFFGCLLNSDYIYLPATTSQVIMLVEPLVLFIAIVSLPFGRDHVVAYSKVLKWLIILEVVLGVLQLPIRLKTGDSEAVHGTFTGNAEQYAAFLIIGIFYLIARATLAPAKRMRYVAAILVIVVLTLSIDNKASWLGITCALGFVLARLGTFRSRLVLMIAGVAFVCGTGLIIGWVATKTSSTLYKYELLFDAIKAGEFKNLGKVKALRDIVRSHFSHLHMLAVGAGASNFYSRSSRQFYFRPSQRELMYVNSSALDDEVRSADSGRASDSMGGVLSVTTRVPYYQKFYGEKDAIFAIGSIQVDSPFSPYSGLLGETGLLGTWLYLSMYLIAVRQLVAWIPHYRTDANILPLLIGALGLMIYLMVNSVYGPFIETTRLTSIAWSMMALVSVYVKHREMGKPGVGEYFERGPTEHAFSGHAAVHPG